MDEHEATEQAATETTQQSEGYAVFGGRDDARGHREDGAAPRVGSPSPPGRTGGGGSPARAAEAGSARPAAGDRSRDPGRGLADRAEKYVGGGPGSRQDPHPDAELTAA